MEKVDECTIDQELADTAACLHSGRRGFVHVLTHQVATLCYVQ